MESIIFKVDEMLPAMLPRSAADPGSGLANGATDIGPHVSPFGWALVGLFTAGALLIVFLTLRHYYWHKWFGKKDDLESGRASGPESG